MRRDHHRNNGETLDALSASTKVFRTSYGDYFALATGTRRRLFSTEKYVSADFTRESGRYGAAGGSLAFFERLANAGELRTYSTPRQAEVGLERSLEEARGAEDSWERVSFESLGKELRANPKLRIQGESATLDGKPLRDLPPKDADLSENILTFAFGSSHFLFGHPYPVFISFFLIDSKDRSVFEKSFLERPLLYPDRGPFHTSTLDAVWSDRRASKIASAVQYFVTPEEVVITHMQTKDSYRRKGINTLMVKMLEEEYPSLQIAFKDPTDLGSRFMRGRGYSRSRK